MDNKDYIKNLKIKRKTKVNKLLEYFNKYYPNVKLKFKLGTMVKVKYKEKTLETFNSTRVIGVKRIVVSKNSNTHLFIILKRFKIDYNTNSYQQIVIPNYLFIIRNIERELIKNGILRTSPKLKRKSYE